MERGESSIEQALVNAVRDIGVYLSRKESSGHNDSVWMSCFLRMKDVLVGLKVPEQEHALILNKVFPAKYTESGLSEYEWEQALRFSVIELASRGVPSVLDTHHAYLNTAFRLALDGTSAEHMECIILKQCASPESCTVMRTRDIAMKLMAQIQLERVHMSSGNQRLRASVADEKLRLVLIMHKLFDDDEYQEEMLHMSDLMVQRGDELEDYFLRGNGPQ